MFVRKEERRASAKSGQAKIGGARGCAEAVSRGLAALASRGMLSRVANRANRMGTA